MRRLLLLAIASRCKERPEVRGGGGLGGHGRSTADVEVLEAEPDDYSELGFHTPSFHVRAFEAALGTTSPSADSTASGLGISGMNGASTNP